MNKTKQKPKLKLNRESLRLLTPGELGRAAGGTEATIVSNCADCLRSRFGHPCFKQTR